MKILLSRHGNTFGSDDTPVWVGAGQDMPLVDKGEAQAAACAKHLREHNIVPSAIYCAPLKRTHKYAEIISKNNELSGVVNVTDKLMEIDYGRWGGKTNDQIAKKFGNDVLQDWREKGIWPSNADWGPSEEEIIGNIQSLLDEITTSYGEEDTVMCISSNGILRYFLEPIGDMFSLYRKQGKLKVATGNICQITYENDRFSLDFWNERP